MKKSTKKFLFVGAAALAGMYAYNCFVASASAKKNMLPTKNGSYYSWKHGNIFYTKIGSGKPVLLVHDTNSASSSVEWSKITKRLQKNHCVYTIDLLGCGLSDKPNLCYTNYLYVQLLTAFIKDVIKEKTDVVATNLSAAPVIMANRMDDSILEKMIFINPVSFRTTEAVPDQESKLKQTLIQLPLIGTCLYNLLMNPKRIDRQFSRVFYKRAQLVPQPLKDAYYEAAHMDNSSGKYLYASILGNYMNTNLRDAVKKLEKPVHLIISSDVKNQQKTAQEYRKLNANIDITNITNCRLYPQLEAPEKIYQIIEGKIK